MFLPFSARVQASVSGEMRQHFTKSHFHFLIIVELTTFGPDIKVSNQEFPRNRNAKTLLPDAGCVGSAL